MLCSMRRIGLTKIAALSEKDSNHIQGIFDAFCDLFLARAVPIWDLKKILKKIGLYLSHIARFFIFLRSKGMLKAHCGTDKHLLYGYDKKYYKYF